MQKPEAVGVAAPAASATRAHPGAVGFSKTLGRSIAPLADSLIPAALACASYGDLSYAWDIAQGADPQAWMGFVDAKSIDNLPRALFLKEVARPATAEELGVDARAAGAIFERGVWNSGSLASAICAVVELPGGVKELHLSVRGTDATARARPWIEGLPKFLGAQTMAAYFGAAYPRINGHAANFDALARSVAKAAADPANGFSRIVVSGHSLGAAAAEALIPTLKSHGAPVSAHLFGNPGHGAGIIGLPMHMAGRAARAVAKTAMAAFSGLIHAAAMGMSPMARPMAWKAGDGVWKAMISLGQPKASDDQFNWRSSGDPIPKLGALLYGTGVRARKTDFGRDPFPWTQYWKLWKAAPVMGSRHSMPLYAASNAAALTEHMSLGNSLDAGHDWIWRKHLSSHEEALALRSQAVATFNATTWAQARSKVEEDGEWWPTDQGERLRQLSRAALAGGGPTQADLAGAVIDQAALRDKLARRRKLSPQMAAILEEARQKAIAKPA